MKHFIKITLTYLILATGTSQIAFAYDHEADLRPEVEVLSCSLKIARWYQGRFYKTLTEISGQITYLGESEDPNDIQPLLWFPNLRDSYLRDLGVFASLVVDPKTGKKLIDVGFYKARTMFPRDKMPEKAWRKTETSARYMLPVFRKQVDSLDDIEISYEDDIKPLHLNITGNLNYKYIDLKCKHLGSVEE